MSCKNIKRERINPKYIQNFRNILKDPDSGFVREMFGAYVLFPYADTEGNIKTILFIKALMLLI